ncbi:hypothetical protein ACTRXD_04520 [Nitrospira sp. T9]|uniref:hypothetical protein n=1 Tax=unclassified Nitrospira TaxID=2652172 RepID=UPI003F96DE22
MKNFLSIIGGIFLVFILIGFGVIAYAAFHGRALDASSKAYVEANLPVILDTWSTNELLKRSSPQLLKAVNEKPEQFDQLFRKLSHLGALRFFSDVKSDSHISFTTEHGKVTIASYVVNATFENGDGRINTRLIQ